MFIIMKTTYNERFYLKVSKQELELDRFGFTQKRQSVSYITKFVLSFISKQIKQQYSPKDGINDTLN